MPLDSDRVIPSTLQLLNARLETVPRPVPGRPLPDWSEPARDEVWQVTVSPDVVSFSVVVPADPEMAPPGVTAQEDTGSLALE